jgi:hypothetical protein
MSVIDYQSTDAYRPLTLAELASMPFPELTWVVQDLLPQGSLTLFSGREKSGKSLLMADLAACVSTGEPFLNRAVTPGGVILVPAEENPRDVLIRLDARLGGDFAVPLRVLPVNQREEDRLDLANPACIARLRRMLEEHHPRLLILDPLRELHELAENEADEMGPLLRPLRNLAHEMDVAIVLTHHMSKSGSSRGSTAILAACDQGWEFQLSEDSVGTEVELAGRLSVKGRYGPRQHLGIRMGEKLRWSCSLHMLPQRPSTLSQIMYLLQWESVPLDAREIATRINCDVRTVQNILSTVGRPGGPIARIGTGRRNDPYRYFPDEVELAS